MEEERRLGRCRLFARSRSRSAQSPLTFEPLHTASLSPWSSALSHHPRLLALAKNLRFHLISTVSTVSLRRSSENPVDQGKSPSLILTRRHSPRTRRRSDSRQPLMVSSNALGLGQDTVVPVDSGLHLKPRRLNGFQRDRARRHTRLTRSSMSTHLTRS